jgi:GT2 family glycosyltransferase
MMNKEKAYPLVSIVTVNFRQTEVTCDMLDSLSALTYPNVELILVDNGCEKDESARFKQHYRGLQLIVSEENLGFAGGTNLGIRRAKGAYILLLNNDTIVPPSFLEPLVERMHAEPNVGMTSPRIYFFDQPDVLQYAGASPINWLSGRGRKFGYGQADDGSFHQSGQTGLCNGACMLVKKEVFEDVGLLSEKYFMYYEEHDFSIRAKKAGWQCYFEAASYIHHRQSISIGRLSPLKTYYLFRNRLLFARRLAGGLPFCLFLMYYLFIAVPAGLCRHAIHREFQHVQSIWKALKWNFSHLNIHSNEKPNY